MRPSEDFALEPVPPTSRSHRIRAILNVLGGIPTALVFLATGAELEASHGTGSLLVGIVIVTVLVSILAYVLTLFAARSGLDSDLTSIYAGFGTRGSAMTSLIYSLNFFILFALESDIIATAVNTQYPDVSRWMVLLLMGIGLLILNWRGVSSLAIAMAVTLPVFLGLLGVFIAKSSTPEHEPALPTDLSSASLISVCGVLMAFVVNATVSADVGRFLGRNTSNGRAALLAVVLQVLSFGGAVGLGAWMQRNLGVANPGAAFVLVLGIWGLLAVGASQLRINLINLYAGSLSLSNFGRRAFEWQPGRAIWSVVLAVGGTLLALSNIYENLLDVLTFEAVFTCAWVGVLVVAILKRRLLAPQDLSARPVAQVDLGGLASLGIAIALAIPIAFGAAGPTVRGFAPFVSLFVAGLSMFVIEGVRGRRTQQKPVVVSAQ
jgi:hypothetical protein